MGKVTQPQQYTLDRILLNPDIKKSEINWKVLQNLIKKGLVDRNLTVTEKGLKQVSYKAKIRMSDPDGLLTRTNEELRQRIRLKDAQIKVLLNICELNLTDIEVEGMK